MGASLLVGTSPSATSTTVYGTCSWACYCHKRQTVTPRLFPFEIKNILIIGKRDIEVILKKIGCPPSCETSKFEKSMGCVPPRVAVPRAAVRPSLKRWTCVFNQYSSILVLGCSETRKTQFRPHVWAGKVRGGRVRRGDATGAVRPGHHRPAGAGAGDRTGLGEGVGSGEVAGTGDGGGGGRPPMHAPETLSQVCATLHWLPAV